MTEIKKMDIPQIQKELTDKRGALRTFRFGGAGSRTRNVREGRTLRKEIARLLTELNARRIANSK